VGPRLFVGFDPQSIQLPRGSMAAMAKPVLSVGTDVIFSRLLGLECHYGANLVADMRLSISVAIAGLLWFSAHVSAQTGKVLYELQERCGKRAEEVFKRDYSPSVPKSYGQITFNYENHYDARLNKCFFLEIAMPHDKGKLIRSKDMRLFDLSENKEYGIYLDGFCDGCGPMTCYVQDKVCRSESE
jgi:hypothetical protein